MDATTISTTRRGQRPDHEAYLPVDDPRSSAALRADRAQLDADRAAAAAHLAELQAGRAAVLLTDDDAKAEAHDAEIQRTSRAIERADLKRPGLVEANQSGTRRIRHRRTDSHGGQRRHAQRGGCAELPELSDGSSLNQCHLTSTGLFTSTGRTTRHVSTPT